VDKMVNGGCSWGRIGGSGKRRENAMGGLGLTPDTC
jgi:hypothetical protein